MKRTRLKPISDKRAAEADARWEVRNAVDRRDRGRCQGYARNAPGPCGGPLDVHEVIPRSAWPGGHLVVDNCILICRRHHEWVGDNPEAAHALGLHGFSWERPQ